MKKLLAIASIALLCSPAFAGDNHGKHYNGKNHHETMTKEYCTSGESGQEVSACLKEMRNSKGEKFPEMRRHDYRENALKRCADLADSDKALCEARFMHGNKSGSVKDGGTITELTVREKTDMAPEMRKDHMFKPQR
jgi:hypothetical protein